MSSDNRQLLPKNSPVNLDIFPVVSRDENESHESQRLLDEKCRHECLYGATESIVRPAQCKITEMDSLHESWRETDWLHVDKPNQPEKPLTKSVRENDVANVEKWISYIKWVEQENVRHPKHVYHKSDPRYDPNHDVPLIDRVDDYDQHYNAVHNAVITNNLDILHMLHGAGADLNRRTNDQAENTPLVLAVFRFSDMVVEQEITGYLRLAQPPSTRNETKTTFHALLKCHRVQQAVNETNHAGITALHAACRRGNDGMVNILLEIKNIDITKMDNHGNTPLHSACAGGNKSVVSSLIDAGANVLEKNKLEMHPFHVAVVNQSLDIVRMIQTDRRVAKMKQELLCAKDDDGNTMFLLAVKSGDDETVKFLLKNGAQIGDTNEAHCNVFHLAASVNSRSIMEMIYAYNADQAQSLIEAKDSSSLTPLHYAARRNQKDVVSFLIDKCDKLEVEDAELNTPLLMAAAEGSSDTMHVLIKKGARLSCTDGKGNNIVHLMVSNDNSNVLKEVLDNHEFAKSTLIDYGNWTGQSALHKACKSGFAENCIELLKRGANPNLKDINGFVPLHYAAESGNIEVVKLLISHRANVDAVDDQIGRTPLCIAAYHGHEGMVEFLVQSGADIDGKFAFSKSEDDAINWKTSPLFASCINGHVRIVKYLLESGADVTVDKRYEDDEGRWSIKGNCLVLATLLGQKDVALCIVNSSKWKSALRWRTSNDEFGERTPLKLLISQMPDVAEVVLNRCMVTIKKQNGTYVKKYYYEFLDDYHNKSHRTRVENIKSDGRGHHNWVQHAFKKEAHAFQVMIDNKRIELLNHPLATQLLTYKWRSYGIFIYYINLISYLLFLGFLTGFTLSLQNPKTEECMPRGFNTHCQGNGKKAFLTGAAVLIVTFSMIRIAVEAFQIYYRHFRYFLDVENWMELYLYSSAIAFVGFGLADDCQCPHPWQWEFGAVTLLIAWLNLVLFLKKFPLTGVYVLMFIHIMNTILRIILLPILFVISFGLTFYMLFYRPDTKTAFSTPANTILKTMMLTMGEFDFDDLFHNTGDDSDQGNSTDPNALPDAVLYPGATYLLWIVFVIMMPIVLTNMLIGLAVDDIKGIQDEAHLTRLALEVDFTMHIEEIGFIRQLFLKRMDKEYYTPDTQKFADSKVEDYPEQVYNCFQRFKLYYFGRSKDHQDDIKIVDEKSSEERIEEEISEISVMVADVHNKVKGGINGKDTSKTGRSSQSKELTEIKKMLAEQKKKQEYIVMLLHHVCSKLPGSFTASTSSGDVFTAEIDEATKGGVYTLESSLPSEHTEGSDDNGIDD